MSVKSFKFVSPGVFINEIDNSFLPRSSPVIGPVVIGRSPRGIAMEPVKVESYSEFVTMFGETVPGFAGGDVYRDGNYQSPMYGAYAAKAFLRSNVAPLTYIRLLGQEDANNDSSVDGQAGWKLLKTIAEAPADNGGAYGLWLFHSGANDSSDPRENIGTGSLAAIVYCNEGALTLSGTVYGGAIRSGEQAADKKMATTASNNIIFGTDTTDNLFTIVVSGTLQGEEKITFGLDDTSDNYIRNKLNTNPQLISGTTFYAAAGSNKATKNYWLGETFDQQLRDNGLTTASLGVMMSISRGASTGPGYMKGQASREARTGWFIGQDLGAATSYVPYEQQKLFRLIGRGHGEWLHKNVKVSIEKIEQSKTTVTEYGNFSVVLRDIRDNDGAIVVLERFDNLSLDPTSPNYLARKIGDKYTSWDAVEGRLKQYGDYNNLSKFVYVEMNSDVDAGATEATYLPFGYFGPPRFRGVYQLFGSGSFELSGGAETRLGAPAGTLMRGVGDLGDYTGGNGHTLAANTFLTGGAGIVYGAKAGVNAKGFMPYMSGGQGLAASGYPSSQGSATGSLVFPVVRLRISASDGGLTDASKAYFGMQTTRTAQSTITDKSIGDFHRLLYAGYSGGGGTSATDRFTTAGVEDYAYVFSLDNVVLKTGTTTGYYYVSGSRARAASYTSSSYTDLLDARVNSFTAPLWGGFDGLDIKKPDPFYNAGMTTSATTLNSYAYYTIKRAIDTVVDPEYVDMNLLAMPGLTNNALTEHMINTCEERGDAMALIDLPSIYHPPHEKYFASKSSRIGTTPILAAAALRDRKIDSSYGATFYPWVQTKDAQTGQMLWIPPTIAMMGVLASSEKKSHLWFAPAGFNRGGLTDGAAGIPITGVTERLTSKDRDTLYESHINPIASFPSSGIVVFGQKTLQQRQSALDRINVRRLVIYLKKKISVLSTEVLFEQNVQSTWNRFKSLVEPFLANTKVQFGISDYRLILDETTTTADLIDQNIMYAKIMVKPTRAIEYIAIDFVIASTGASFDD